MSSKRANRYNDEFKKQIVVLIDNGKKINEIVKEYNVARSIVHKWVRDFSNSGSFKAKDNRTDQEKELIKLRKENQQLKMENDILKQATLIMLLQKLLLIEYLLTLRNWNMNYLIM